MCYSATTSLQTYSVAMIGFLLGWIYGFPRSYLWFGFVFSQMQLVEYFLWTNLRVRSWNRFFSILGAIVVFLEPIFALQLTGPHLNLILAYIGLMFVALLFSPPIDFSTQIGADGHLHWNFLQPLFSVMSVIWFGFFFYGLLRIGTWKVYAIVLGTMLYAYFKIGFKRTWSSYWCFLANVFWLYVIAWVLLGRK